MKPHREVLIAWAAAALICAGFWTAAYHFAQEIIRAVLRPVLN